ncbi:hypothetical protein YC2023_089290 [Brassica napus]
MLLIDEQVYSDIFDFSFIGFAWSMKLLTFVAFSYFRYEQGTVIQGFIPPSRIDTYLPHMIDGSIYRLNKFYGSKSKIVYRVAELDVTIAFSWNFVLSDLEDCPVQFPEDWFHFYGYEEFEAACDLKGDLYDWIKWEHWNGGKVVHEHQGWRLVTCMWLHAGIIHLLTSMLSLIFICIRLEQQFVFSKFLPLRTYNLLVISSK